MPALFLLLGELVPEGNGKAGPTPHADKRCVKFSEEALDDDCGNQCILILYITYNQEIKTHSKWEIRAIFNRDTVVFLFLMLTHPTCCDEASFSGRKPSQWSERKASLLHTLEQAAEGHRTEDRPLKSKHTFNIQSCPSFYGASCTKSFLNKNRDKYFLYIWRWQ